MLPEQIALVFAQAGGADAAQVLDVTGSPEAEDGVIAYDERAGHRQEFTCDTLEGVFKRFPRRVGNNRGAMYIHTAPASAPGQLTILIGREQTHLLTIKFAQAAHYNGARRHIHAKGKRIGGKNCAQVPSSKQRFYQ